MFLSQCSLDILWILGNLPKNLEMRRSNTRSYNGLVILSGLKHDRYDSCSLFQEHNEIWSQVDIDHMRFMTWGAEQKAHHTLQCLDNYFELYIKVLDQSAC